MNDWTSGYVAEIGYTFGYCAELNPLRVQLIFLNAGIVAPEIGAACELGFGQGISTNFHAAASVTQWHGTDFNPAHAGFAQELAGTSGSGAKLYDQAFAEFAGRADLPDFDYIGLHGVWSWISDENRAVVVDFIRRKLKVGGVLFISYNTLPGWASLLPVQHLLKQFADTQTAPGMGLVNRINSAIDFAEKLLGTNPLFALSNPHLTERLKKLKTEDRHYLAHEYFNRDWQPMHFATMGEWLAPAKLDYACSAHYLDHIDAVNLSVPQQAFLHEIPDPLFRETVRDVMVIQRFRRDYWVKGKRQINLLEQTDALNSHKVLLVVPCADFVFKTTGSMGEANLVKAIYQPILDCLADHKPKTLAQISAAVKSAGIEFMQLRHAIMILLGKGDLVTVQDEKTIAKAKLSTGKINLYLMNKSRCVNYINFLASPASGGGIIVKRIHQLFLLARLQGGKTPEDWTAFTWKILKEQGQKLTHEGKILDSDKENIAYLDTQSKQFLHKYLPIFQALGIAA